ncbi:MAG: 23S rRNA (pseudouridine(1915)-N(3))-methyltransferase RlmH [Rickettsiales bacterium]|nr:23S rRNA (pseudouridine(1915)-N(3))-methyltransferase RlmH [Rickettsiales bacterium]
MKITIISIGKFENSPHRFAFENYLKRMKWDIELKELDLKNAHNLSVDKIKEGEGRLIAKAIKSGSVIIALDEKGKEFTSQNFAKLIADFAVKGNSNLTFLIGGSNGLSSEIIGLANLKIALGLMTFPHLMVRAMLIEQLYRSQSIIAGHPYHKE